MKVYPIPLRITDKVIDENDMMVKEEIIERSSLAYDSLVIIMGTVAS